SACVAEGMIEDDLYDFLLFSLPDNDWYSHANGPEATEESIRHADKCFERIVVKSGGIDAFLEQHAVLLMSDHSQSPVDRRLPLAAALGEEWRVLQPNSTRPEDAELAVSPTARAANVYVLREGSYHERAHAKVRVKLGDMEGVDLVAWLRGGGGQVPERTEVGMPQGRGLAAVLESGGRELRFMPGGDVVDRRGRSWEVEGDLAV